MTRDSVGDWQKRAWSYYGVPGLGLGCRAVGEVHYVNSWLADQMTRLDWDITIGGNPDWSVDLPGGTTITTTKPVDGDPEQDQTAASAELLSLIDWDDANVRSVTTNLFVAGQGNYILEDDGWRVISVVEKDRVKTIKDAETDIPFLWPHPADKTKPDAPLFSVLELLAELDWLNQQAKTQSKQRVMISGILGISDSFEGPNGSSFWDEWNNNLSAKMVNPDDLSPIRLSGPTSGDSNLIKDGINWVIPDFGYDDVLDRRVLAAINRLAYGLPVPPEILLGMQAQSRATAFQVEENAYRAHIEPPALLVAQVAQDALNEILDQEVEVVPNATRLLGRRNSVQDVKDAYDRKLVRGSYVREVLGIPEDEADPDFPNGVVPGSVPAVTPAEPDPANVAADEAVTASAGFNGDELSDLLSDIDAALSSELAGATVMATDRARQKLGAAARTNETVRTNPDYKALSQADLASALGFDGLTLAGVDVADKVTEPIEAAATWWTRRVNEAWSQVATLVPGWTGQPDWITQSSALLVQSLATHVVDTLAVEPVPPLEAEHIRHVVDASAGGN